MQNIRIRENLSEEKLSIIWMHEAILAVQFWLFPTVNLDLENNYIFVYLFIDILHVSKNQN